MLLRKLAIVAALILAVSAAAGVFLDFPGLAGRPAEGRGTLALAPISLGHPSAAATLKTRSEAGPVDPSGATGSAPEFRYPLRVGPGDTLAGLLTGAGIEAKDAHAAIAALAKHFNPRHIRRGEEIQVLFRPWPLGSDAADAATPGRFIGLEVEPNYDVVIHVARLTGGGFRAERMEKALSRHPVRAEGEISSSLYIAGRKAGLPHGVLAELIRAYSWDVDFQRDIRDGDRFEVMYERVLDKAGETVHAGPIRFARLKLSGKDLAIYLHTTADGEEDYFDAKGQSARKALMRTPIDGARLSSGFGKRRHPILGYTKMHRGVDFAAPSGTPIYAAGNGTVTHAGRNGAYGNYISIRHNERYSTAYGHLRAFARGVRAGKRVTQGQIIGTVGTTGRSTGPHLHYEILVSGTRTNPLKVRMPSGRKLEGDELERFHLARTQIERAFAELTPQRVASAEPTQ